MRAIVLILAVGALLVGCRGDAEGAPPAEPGTLVPTATAPSITATVPAPLATAPQATESAPPSPEATATPFAGAVARLAVADLDLEMEVATLGLDDDLRALEAPPLNGVGWYEVYGRPGWGGHSLFSGWWRDGPGTPPGPFFEINERLSEGSHVVVEMEDGSTYTYEVYALLGDPGVVAFIDPADRPDDETLALMSCPQLEGGVTCFGALAARVDDEGAAD